MELDRSRKKKKREGGKEEREICERENRISFEIYNIRILLTVNHRFSLLISDVLSEFAPSMFALIRY